ncbi:DNA-binding protein [Enterococcus faecalis]|jgi:hypothetical protein|uniref:DNA-binding protein n=1 Tax=Enterococcus faecalis TaxID=1351 RepID=UPI00209137E5|nr:DNA-binding protein [Enterococcus faecalis]MCO5446153.1 DNA-binding protein [Enterococcus faecalis]
MNQSFQKIVTKQQLPLVLTNEDLRKMFQVSDSTLNRLFKTESFPIYWLGIRGHYLRDEVLEWLEMSDQDEFRENLELLRSF